MDNKTHLYAITLVRPLPADALPDLVRHAHALPNLWQSDFEHYAPALCAQGYRVGQVQLIEDASGDYPRVTVQQIAPPLARPLEEIPLDESLWHRPTGPRPVDRMSDLLCKLDARVTALLEYCEAPIAKGMSTASVAEFGRTIHNAMAGLAMVRDELAQLPPHDAYAKAAEACGEMERQCGLAANVSMPLAQRVRALIGQFRQVADDVVGDSEMFDGRDLVAVARGNRQANRLLSQCLNAFREASVDPDGIPDALMLLRPELERFVTGGPPATDPLVAMAADLERQWQVVIDAGSVGIDFFSAGVPATVRVLIEEVRRGAPGPQQPVFNAMLLQTVQTGRRQSKVPNLANTSKPATSLVEQLQGIRVEPAYPVDGRGFDHGVARMRAAAVATAQQAAVENPAVKRYVIAEKWTQFLPGSQGCEVAIRWIYDRQVKTLVYADMATPHGGFNSILPGDRSWWDDLLEHVCGANEHALANPAEYGLTESDERPAWAIYLAKADARNDQDWSDARYSANA